MCKNKSFTLLLCFAFICTINLRADNRQYKIVGTITEQLNGRQVMLMKFLDNRVTNVDSVIVKKGSFEFSGETDVPTYAIISCGNYPDSVFHAKLMIESGQINVELSKRSHIGGTPLNVVYHDFQKQIDILLDSIKLVYEQKKNNIITEELQDALLTKLSKKLSRTKVEFWIANSSNELGVIHFKDNLPGMFLPNFFEVFSRSDSMVKHLLATITRACLKGGF